MTPRQRLTRGLQYTAVGPVDITRGTVGLACTARPPRAAAFVSSTARAGSPRSGSAAQETLARELAAAQEVVANLPQALQDARRPKHPRRRWRW